MRSLVTTNTECPASGHRYIRAAGDFLGRGRTPAISQRRPSVRDSAREFDLFVLCVDLQIVPVDADQADIARSAWRRYGKGRHPAALNFGDCFSYALAKSLGEPLLAKGTDFARTDVEIFPVT